MIVHEKSKSLDSLILNLVNLFFKATSGWVVGLTPKIKCFC